MVLFLRKRLRRIRKTQSTKQVSNCESLLSSLLVKVSYLKALRIKKIICQNICNNVNTSHERFRQYKKDKSNKDKVWKIYEILYLMVYMTLFTPRNIFQVLYRKLLYSIIFTEISVTASTYANLHSILLWLSTGQIL